MHSKEAQNIHDLEIRPGLNVIVTQTMDIFRIRLLPRYRRVTERQRGAAATEMDTGQV